MQLYDEYLNSSQKSTATLCCTRLLSHLYMVNFIYVYLSAKQFFLIVISTKWLNLHIFFAKDVDERVPEMA